ncbi:GntR family transcriptional regulator [Streptomyces sp. NPDC001667]
MNNVPESANPTEAQHPYMRLAAEFRRRILDGELPEGTKLPNHRTLAAEHGVAVATLQKALGQLQVEGYIQCRVVRALGCLSRRLMQGRSSC